MVLTSQGCDKQGIEAALACDTSESGTCDVNVVTLASCHCLSAKS